MIIIIKKGLDVDTSRPQRQSKQRQAILEDLRGLTSHPTAADLYQMVRARLPRISLGTVYRNLELLAEMGAIQKLEMGGTEARFDGNADYHHHIRCLRCGRVDDLHDVSQVLTDVLAGVRRAHTSGYDILGYQLVFSGICPGCGEKQPDDAN